VQEKFIPNILSTSSAVLDNASYHTMQENKAYSHSHKAIIQNWLRHNNIPSDLDITKSDM
jgi:hypothetical protein